MTMNIYLIYICTRFSIYSTFKTNMIMKKVLFMAVAAAAISFASCTNSAKGDANAADSTATPAVENVAEDVTKDLQSKLDAKDANGMQAALATINEKIEALKKEGKLEEAKALVKQVQDWLTTNAETVKSVVGENETLNKLVEGVKAIPVEALGAGEQAVEGAKAAADAAKDKADAAVDAAKQKTNEAVDAAKQKAADKINEAADKAADKAIKGLGL